jgi:hypothetical protein
MFTLTFTNLDLSIKKHLYPDGVLICDNLTSHTLHVFNKEGIGQGLEILTTYFNPTYKVTQTSEQLNLSLPLKYQKFTINNQTYTELTELVMLEFSKT